MKKIDHTGEVINYVTVIRFIGNNKSNLPTWECKCVCGKIMIKTSSNIKHSKSCGCKNSNRHNLKYSHKRAYSIWNSMKVRVVSKHRDSAKWYANKNISVSDEWKSSFPIFLNDMGDPPDGFTLDRIDNNLGYSKENCRWSTAVDQAKNRKSTNWFIYKNQKLTTTELAKESGVPRTSIQAAIAKGSVSNLIPGAVLLSKGDKGL